jgi:ankyrin repeat protein
MIFQAIFKDERQHLKEALCMYNPDKPLLFRGHSPLSFAVTLGRKECIEIILASGSASVLAKNSELWSPFNEAVSFGDRDIIRSVYLERRKELAGWFQEKGAKLLQDLSNVFFLN